jgi:Fic family protein
MEFVLNFEQELLVETIIAVHDMIVNDIRWHGAKGITNDTRSVLTNEGRYIPPVGKSKIESMLKGVLERSHTIENPYAKAIFLQLAIAHIQPFEDGNKRTARAIGGIPLIQSGITPFSYDGVNKERYIDAICRYYEYGDSVDKFGGVILNAYESQIETLVACLQEKIADA